ncbi:hypothetical protein ACRJ4B_43150 [Streptomyces sp. GTA36]
MPATTDNAPVAAYPSMRRAASVSPRFAAGAGTTARRASWNLPGGTGLAQ